MDLKRHELQSQGRGRHCCKAGPCVGNAVAIIGFAMRPGVAGRKPGTVVLVPAFIVGGLCVSRSPGVPSIKPSACCSP